MSRVFVFAALCLAVAGCASESGQQFDTSTVGEIRTGVTTTTQAQALLGDPMQRNSLANGDATWVYDYTKAQSDAGKHLAMSSGMYVAGAMASMIPGVGQFAMLPASAGMIATGASGTHTQTERQSLIIKFHKGVVQNCTLQTLEMTASTSGFVMLGNVSSKQKSDQREINCEDLGRTATAQAKQ